MVFWVYEIYENPKFYDVVSIDYLLVWKSDAINVCFMSLKPLKIWNVEIKEAWFSSSSGEQ